MLGRGAREFARPGHGLYSHMRLPVRVLLLIASLLSTAVPATAQDLDNVTISGWVRDQNGAVIPDTRVTATLLTTNSQRTTTTDDSGQYKLVQLEPGTYDLQALASGFQVK